ncbi:MAG: hypothetical protein WCI52_02040 [bacterium]
MKEIINSIPADNKDAVIGEIGSILTEVSVMGFNDYEIPTLQRLMEDVRTGKVDPQAALSQARTIINSKQDYH